MSTSVHDHVVRFRVNRALVARAEQSARAEGMTLSEFIRLALRRELKDAA